MILNIIFLVFTVNGEMVFAVWNFLLTLGLCAIHFISALCIDKTRMNLTSVPKDINALVADLNLDCNHITRITNMSFVPYRELYILRVNNNGLTYIEDGSFQNNAKLEQLLVARNSIMQLPHSFGPAAASLRKINFWCALRHEAFSTANFSEMIRLEWLNLGCVNLNGKFHASVLPRNLKYIGLGWVGLSQFPDLARYTPNVATVGLTGNAITDISREKPVGNLVLQELYLPRNRISTMPDLYHLPLLYLGLAKNPLVCDSALCWIRMKPWMETSFSNDDITCENPDTLQDILLMDINPITLACETGGSKWSKLISIFINHAID